MCGGMQHKQTGYVHTLDVTESSRPGTHVHCCLCLCVFVQVACRLAIRPKPCAEQTKLGDVQIKTQAGEQVQLFRLVRGVDT